MSILQMSISASIFIIAIIIIRAAALHKLPKKMFLILWGIVLFRLLVPVSVPSRFSVYNVINWLINYCSPRLPATLRDHSLSFSGLTENTRQIEEATSGHVFPIAPITIISIIWITGILAIFIFFTIRYFKVQRELRFSLPIRNNVFIEKWLAEHRLLRRITILQSDRIITPVAVGLVKPRIILPKTINMDDDQLLQFVLAHEYYHIRHFDILWKFILLFALCIHWFNPFVWIMLILATRDLELVCDEAVIRHFGAGTKAAYANSIIGMAERQRKFMPLFNSFSKNVAIERIVSIMKYKKTSLMTIGLATILIVGTTTAFATNMQIPSATSADTDIRDSAASADTNIRDSATGTGIRDSAITTSYESETSTSNNYSNYMFQDVLADYSKFGLTFDGTDYYYQGQSVRFFVDNRNTTGKFVGTVIDQNSGSYYLEARRDSENRLIAIDEISKEHADEISFWR